MADQSSVHMQDVSKAVGQLCTQLSYVNALVPKFDECKDVYEFLTEFNNATTVLTSEQKLPLLAKAFNHGELKCWYTTELLPLIENQKPWEEVRQKIINRFTDIEDRERHFNKLKEMSFKPGQGKKVLNFAENFIYSYKKAYAEEASDMNCIRALKASLPIEIRNKLLDKPEFKNATSLAQLKEALKFYDLSQSFEVEHKQSTAGLEAIIQKLANQIEQVQSKMELINKENKDTKESIKAALISKQEEIIDHMRIAAIEHRSSKDGLYKSEYKQRLATPPSSPKSRPYFRSSSPSANKEYYNKRRDSETSREQSPGRSYRPSHRVYYQDQREYRPRSPEPTRQDFRRQSEYKAIRAFDDDKYWKKFGKPPRPCGGCNAWHWEHHCPEVHLK